ncbi:MAG: prepilin peptidase [Anaerolineae bacterium]|nr:prepilin peptidase [Anaerolineae bacterium]
MVVSLVADGLLLAWLAACAFHDLRERTVPNWLTVPLLLLTAGWRMAQGGWEVVILVAALIAGSDLPRRSWRLALAGLAGGSVLMAAGSLESGLLGLAVLLEWLLWEFGLTGGADAKIILALLLVTGDARLLVWISLAGGLQGLAGLILKRKTIPYTLAILFGTLLWFLPGGGL